MKLRLIVSDIDGTLLTDRGVFLPQTEEALISLLKKGIHFATPSARTVPSTFGLPPSVWQLCTAGAFVNGSYVVTQSGVILENAPLERNAIAELLGGLESSESTWG